MTRIVFGCFVIVLLSTTLASADLLISDYLRLTISRYHSQTGTSMGVFAGYGQGVRGPEGMTLGADGNVYVVMDDISNDPETINRFSPTGQPLGVFAHLGSATFPNRLTFGPDGNLYVTFATGSPVRKYNGLTGAFIGDFGTGGGMQIGVGLTFGPDGRFYVASYTSGSIKQYDGVSGAYINDFASGSGLVEPTGIVFGPDGNLYVASRGTDQIKRYDGDSGVFIDNFAQGGGLDEPEDLAFGPDGNLYVTSFRNNQVIRFHGVTGSFMNAFIARVGSEGYPVGLLFVPVPEPSSTCSVFVIAALTALSRHQGLFRRLRFNC